MGAAQSEGNLGFIMDDY